MIVIQKPKSLKLLEKQEADLRQKMRTYRDNWNSADNVPLRMIEKRLAKNIDQQIVILDRKRK